MTPTLCRDCEHVHDRKRAARYWLCIKFPRIEAANFVNPGEWVEQEPYMLCRYINGGMCPLFEPMKGEENEA